MDDLARPLPEPAKTKRRPIILGLGVFAILFFGDLYVNHGTQLALTLPMSVLIAVWAGFRERRRA